jgi:hypothetical protein
MRVEILAEFTAQKTGAPRTLGPPQLRAIFKNAWKPVSRTISVQKLRKLMNWTDTGYLEIPYYLATEDTNDCHRLPSRIRVLVLICKWKCDSIPFRGLRKLHRIYCFESLFPIPLHHHHHHQWRYSPDRALASLTRFKIVVVRCGLSAPRSICSTHPDSAIRDM